MGPLMLGFIICISLIPSFLVSAQLVSTTLHSTHPQVTYAPESCCARNFFRRCVRRYDPFTMSTYFDSNGQRRTFFQTGSNGNEPKSWNMKRRVQVKFHGRAVYVYGAAQARLDHRLGHIQVTLDGVFMENIDLEARYRETNNDPWNPQLIYHWEWGGNDAAHVLEISLLDSATGFWRWHPVRGFGFDSIVYTSAEPWRPPKYELSASEKLENVKIHDTNFVTSFQPSSAWEKVSDIASSEGIQTFHGTSNELVQYSQNAGVTPVAKFTAHCAALTVYGASPAQLQATYPEGFRHGHLQLCLWKSCEYIDAHQAYLNVPQHLWTEPVLLYSTDRMSPRVSETVTMRLLDPSSPVGHLWTMTFSHAVCSRVVRKWPWTHPISDGNYSSQLVPHHELDYGPSFLFSFFSTWMRTDLYSFGNANPWFLGLFGPMPSWSTTVRGYDIQIFVPFPTQYPATHYANLRCCIDGRCHYPDVEQWFLKARNAQSEVPLVHYQDLNPFRDHHISMAVVRGYDEVGEKVTAVSRIVSQQVVVPCHPPPNSTPPSEPPECLSWPGLEEPGEDEDGDLEGIKMIAAVVVLVFLWWCWALSSVDDKRRRSEKQPLLPSPGSAKQPRRGAQSAIGQSYSSCETDRSRKSKLAVDQNSGPLGSGCGPIPPPGDYHKQRSNFSREIERSEPEFDSPSKPNGSQQCAPGPSNAGRSRNPGPPATSRNRPGPESSTFVTDWIASTTSHHHQHPFSPDVADGAFGPFNPSGYPSPAVRYSADFVQDGYQPARPLDSYIDPSFYRYSSGPPSSDLSPATMDERQLSSPYTVSETLPPYSDPPSYPASVVTVIGSPPRPHGFTSVPRPTLPLQWDLSTPSNNTLQQFYGNFGPGGPHVRTQNNEFQQMGPLPTPEPTARSGGEGRRARRYQHPPDEMMVPSLSAVEVMGADMEGRGEGSSAPRRSRRNRGRRTRRETTDLMNENSFREE